MAAAIAPPAAGWLTGCAIHNLLFYLDKLPLSNTLISTLKRSRRVDNKLFYCYTQVKSALQARDFWQILLDPDPALAGEGSEKIMLKQILQALEEIIYPRYCLLCHIRIALENQFRLVICRDCIEKIKPNRPPFCRKCGRKILKFEAPENVCAECSKTQFCFERAWASCTYEGVIKEMVHNLKYGNKIMLAKVLSQMMIDFVSDYHLPLEACDCAIAIPLSPRKLREREFNQAEALADNLCAHIGLKLLRII